jgi:hypothetical protein
MVKSDHLNGIGTHVMYPCSAPLDGGEDLLPASLVLINQFTRLPEAQSEAREWEKIMFGVL